MTLRLLATAFYLLVSTSVFAQRIPGKAVKITDGDTFHFLADSTGRLYKVRLHGIDAPEMRQDFGPQARARFAAMASGRQVWLDSLGTDRYGRTVGAVYVGGDTCLNVLLVAEGCAWHYLKYSPAGPMHEKLAGAEAEARRRAAGLWARPEPVAPWIFRH